MSCRYDVNMAHSDNKRATIYFDKQVHRILRLKAAETHRSISSIVNDAVRRALMEDAEDLAAFEARESEPTLTYEEMLKALKADGTL